MKTQRTHVIEAFRMGWGWPGILMVFLGCCLAGLRPEAKDAFSPASHASERESFEKIRARAQGGEVFAQEVMGVGYLIPNAVGPRPRPAPRRHR